MPEDLTGTPGQPTGGVTGTPAAPATPEITSDQIKAHPEYRKLVGEYTRVSQQFAEAQPFMPLIQELEVDEEAAAYLERRLQERGRIPRTATGAPAGAMPGVSPQVNLPPEVVALLNPIQEKLTQLEQANQEREAREAEAFRSSEWSKTTGGFEKIMGRPMTDLEKGRVYDNLRRTGSGNLWSSALEVFHDEFMARAAQLQTEGAQNAANEARRMATEGTANAGLAPKIDFAKTSMDELRSMARSAAGATGESTRYMPLKTE